MTTAREQFLDDLLEVAKPLEEKANAQVEKYERRAKTAVAVFAASVALGIAEVPYISDIMSLGSIYLGLSSLNKSMKAEEQPFYNVQERILAKDHAASKFMNEELLEEHYKFMSEHFKDLKPEDKIKAHLTAPILYLNIRIK